MEFYEFFNMAWLLLQEFVLGSDDVHVVASRCLTMLWVSLFVGFAIYVVFLVLGGIGLNVMAEREGKKRSVLAYLPFANTWFAGKIAGEANFFGQKMKRAGLYAAILEGVYTVVNLLSVFSTFIMYMHPMEVTRENSYGETVRYIDVNIGEIPVNLRWLFEGEIWILVIELVLSVALVAFFCVIFIALFRKYYARSPILMTFLCAILPFRGAVLFAVRKNKPVDYNAYIRQRMEAANRRQYGPYGPGGYGPYNGQNGPYNGQGGGYNGQGSAYGNTSRQDDPYSDFGGQNGNAAPPTDDPFSDF